MHQLKIKVHLSGRAEDIILPLTELLKNLSQSLWGTWPNLTRPDPGLLPLMQSRAVAINYTSNKQILTILAIN